MPWLDSSSRVKESRRDIATEANARNEVRVIAFYDKSRTFPETNLNGELT